MSAGGDAVEAATGATGVLAARLAGRIADLGTELLLARILGPAGYGLYALGFTLLQVCGPVGDLGLVQAVVQFGARALGRDPLRLKGILTRALALAPLSGAAAGAALYVLADPLARLMREPEAAGVLRACAPVVPLLSWLRVAAAATRASLRMRYSAIAQDLAQSVAQLALVALLAVATRGLTPGGAIGAYGGSLLVGLVLAARAVHHLFADALATPGTPPPVLREMLRFGLPTLAAEILARLNGRIERFVIAYFATTAEVGVFQAASQPAMVLAVLLGALTTSLGPRVASLWGDGEVARLDALFKSATRWGLVVALPLFLVLVLVPGEVMRVAFGAGYAGGAAVLVLLACSQLANVLSGSVGVVLVQTGHQKSWLATSLGALVLDVALCAALLPRFGIAGAAAAALVANVLRFAACLALAKVRVGAWPYDRRYGKPALAALAAVAAGLLCRLAFGGGPAIVLAAVTASVAAAYVATLAGLGLEPEDRALLVRLRVALARRT